MTQPPNITYTFSPLPLSPYQGYRLAMRKPRNKLEARLQTLDPGPGWLRSRPGAQRYVEETGLTS